jgi:hypothetical protein
VVATTPLTVRVNVVVCTPAPEVPVTVTVYCPAGVEVDVVTVMVELPPAVTVPGLNDTRAPVGCPLALRATFGAVPMAVVETVAVAAEPAVTVAVVGCTPMVKSLGGETVRVKPWLAGLPAPVAVMVIGYELFEPAAGVPARVAVPFPLSVSVTPVGKAPVWVMAGAGDPVVVTVKVLATPWVKVAPATEVIAAGVSTVRVKVVEWVVVPVPVMVTG